MSRWYTARGYEILDRNWRSPTGELDLVVCSAAVIVFCEIKARASDRFGPPQAAVGRAKLYYLRERSGKSAKIKEKRDR